MPEEGTDYRGRPAPNRNAPARAMKIDGVNCFWTNEDARPVTFVVFMWRCWSWTPLVLELDCTPLVLLGPSARPSPESVSRNQTTVTRLWWLCSLQITPVKLTANNQTKEGRAGKLRTVTLIILDGYYAGRTKGFNLSLKRTASGTSKSLSIFVENNERYRSHSFGLMFKITKRFRQVQPYLQAMRIKRWCERIFEHELSWSRICCSITVSACLLCINEPVNHDKDFVSCTTNMLPKKMVGLTEDA